MPMRGLYHALGFALLQPLQGLGERRAPATYPPGQRHTGAARIAKRATEQYRALLELSVECIGRGNDLCLGWRQQIQHELLGIARAGIHTRQFRTAIKYLGEILPLAATRDTA